MSTNSRFQDMGNGMVSEMISQQTQLFYNPNTQEVRVIFNGSPYLYINNQYVMLAQENDILRVELTDRMTLCVGRPGDIDPVTGADLSQISVAGQLMLMKRAYDLFHNERAAAIAAQIAAENAAAEAAAAAAPTSPPEEGENS